MDADACQTATNFGRTSKKGANPKYDIPTSGRQTSRRSYKGQGGIHGVGVGRMITQWRRST